MSLAFSFGVVVTLGLMDGELERFFPSGCFLFQLLGLPCLHSGGGRQGRQSLAGPSVLRDDCLVLVPVSPLPLLCFPGRFDVPGVLVSGSGLAASACSHACGRYLRIALGPGLAFHSSLFLVEGSSDGSAPGDRFLSPGRLCSFTPFQLRSVASALSLLGSGLFFLLWSVGFCRIQWRLSSWKLLGVPVRVGSSSSLHG